MRRPRRPGRSRHRPSARLTGPIYSGSDLQWKRRDPHRTFLLVRELGLRKATPYDLLQVASAQALPFDALQQFLIMADFTLPLVRQVWPIAARPSQRVVDLDRRHCELGTSGARQVQQPVDHPAHAPRDPVNARQVL